MNKKALYESILRDVAKVVKKRLNEMNPGVYENASYKILDNIIDFLKNEIKLSETDSETFSQTVTFIILEMNNEDDFEPFSYEWFKNNLIKELRNRHTFERMTTKKILSILMEYPNLLKEFYRYYKLYLHSNYIHYDINQMIDRGYIGFDGIDWWMNAEIIYSYSSGIERLTNKKENSFSIKIYAKTIEDLFKRACILQKSVIEVEYNPNVKNLVNKQNDVVQEIFDNMKKNDYDYNNYSIVNRKISSSNPEYSERIINKLLDDIMEYQYSY